MKYIGLLFLWLLSTDLFAYDFEVDGIYYNITSIEKSEVEVTYGDNKYSGAIIIPETVNCNGVYYSITSLGKLSFKNCTTLKDISMPKTISSIGENAFYNCDYIDFIRITDLTAWCKISYPEEDGLSSTPRPEHLILNGDEIIDLIIPNDIEQIGSYTFEGCTGIKTLKIQDGITSIGKNAFKWCKFSSISLPSTLNEIGESAFQQCDCLTSIEIPENVKSIGAYAFIGCSNLVYVKSNIKDVFDIANSTFSGLDTYAILHVPYGYKQKYIDAKGWYSIYSFQDIQETNATFNILTLYSVGRGGLIYNNKIWTSKSFAIKKGTDVSIYVQPDNGYYIESFKVNGNDAKGLLKGKWFVLDNFDTNTLIEATFSSEPLKNYTLSIVAVGNGSIIYGNSTIRSTTKSFNIEEGLSTNIIISPDIGYRIKSVKVNSIDVTSSVSGYQYTIRNITSDTIVEVEFEAIPVNTYTLNIVVAGNGSVIYNNTDVRNGSEAFTVNEGSIVTVVFIPDNGNRLNMVKLNGTDVTSRVSGNSFSINNLAANTNLEITFVEGVNAFTVDGVNYSILSQSDKTVNVVGGHYGQELTIPATVTSNGSIWKIVGIEADALKDNAGLAAVIWEPEVAFTATVSNPNLLLYVKTESYAPRAIHNVVVNGTAANITLVEAADGNDFYCPQAFTAQHISFTHNYQMQTGLGESKGWETIALPFDVQTITHETKGTIVPFANWKNGDTSKPFWLMELTGTGFVEAGSIKAYTPYIISMPNHPQYDSQWLLNGKVTFAASSVTVGKTEDLNQSIFNGRTFIPCFAGKKVDEGFYALNVNNDWETNNSGMTEGSMFVWRLRNVHPFEAYLTSSSSAPRYAIGVFEDMTTGIRVMVDGSWMMGEAVYDLQGRKVESPSTKGVYIMNGKKKIIK